MKLQDLHSYIDIDVEECLEERFMDSEELYVRFLRKLAAADDLRTVEQLIAAQDWQEALRKAHNLKGVCASLGLHTLTAQLIELVRLLRSDAFTAAQLQEQLAVIRPEWNRTLDCIRQLD